MYCVSIRLGPRGAAALLQNTPVKTNLRQERAMRLAHSKPDVNIFIADRKFGSAEPAAATALRALTLVTLAFLLIAARPARSQETVLYTFNSVSIGGPGAYDPQSSLTFDNSGNLYGTTVFGGLYTAGTVYQLKLSAGLWSETILYNFTGGSDGNCFTGNLQYCSNLIFDGANFYGTAPAGGANNVGVVFELSPEPGGGCPPGSNSGNGWCETVLHNFGGPGDGAYPLHGVIRDSQGNLYGTTNTVDGIAYELMGGTWAESIIYTLPYNDGDNLEGGLAMDAAGNLYGTSYQTVFELSQNPPGVWTPTVIHTFTGPPNDAGPGSAPLVIDSAGNLYGVSDGGGSENDGAVYKLTPKTNGEWTERLLYSFKTTNPGGYHSSSVVLDASGNLYGTTGDGGSFGDGMVYELIAPGYKEDTLFSFNEKDGSAPFGSLILDSAGNLYGTTSEGGLYVDGQYDGTVFELNPSAAATTTTLSSSPNPSAYGQTVVFSAMITSSNGAPPDGENVTFMQGTTVLGTGMLSGGTATFPDSTLAVGTKAITAVYGGDFNFIGSTSKADSQVIGKASTTTALNSLQNPSSYEQPVTFTATVSPQFSGTPTGSVTFYNGTAALGTVTLSNGTASYTTTKLAVGTESITAGYKGSSSFSASTSAAISQVVNPASTTTTLVSSLNPSNFGQSVTFTATVAAQFGGTVTGSVTFMDGGTTLKTVNLGGGIAKYTTSSLASGSHDITATYNGAADFTTSSASLTQTVN